MGDLSVPLGRELIRVCQEGSGRTQTESGAARLIGGQSLGIKGWFHRDAPRYCLGGAFTSLNAACGPSRLTFAFLSVNSVAMEISGQRQGAVTETDARLPEVLVPVGFSATTTAPSHTLSSEP